MNIYVNVIVSWAIFYFIAIFQSVLPWSTCGNEWNTDDCVTTDMNISDRTNDSVASVEEYWERRVLKISTGIGDVNEFRWELFFTMAIAWLLVYAMLWRGLHNSGKLIWITALFPYVVMTILLIKAVTLPGAGTGIMYYLVPEWERLKDAQVWIAAGSQIFFSYGIGTGSLFALGSYNNYNSNCYRDTIIVGFINSGTSIYAGFCTFAILGFMAQSQGKEVGDVITSGPGLVFIVYPEVVSQLPMPQLWAALYLIMFALIGLDSQYCTVQGVITAIMDMFPNQLLPRRKLLVFCTCVFYMLVATPMLTDGGMYLFQLFDAFSASGISLIFIVFCETIAIAWIYGAERVYDGINDMIGFYPIRWWKFCWQFVCPIAMIAIFVFNFVAYEKFLYAGWYEYPPWGYAIAWLLSCMSMVWIPVYAVYYVISQAYGAPTEKTSFSAKLRHVVDKGSTAKIGFGEDDRTSSMANMELDASGISRGDSDDQLVDKELAPVSFVVNSNPAFNEKF